MRKLILACISIALILIVASCDMVTPVSKSERLSMFIDDLNAPNYSSMPEHFSQAIMGGGWNKVTSTGIGGYWEGGSDGWNNKPFTYTTLSSSGNSITVDITNGSSSTTEHTFYFVEEEEDIWLIYRVDKDGAGTILQ